MAQDLVQWSFECLLGWKWHSFSGQPVLSAELPSWWKLPPTIRINFPCCSSCPLPFILSACTMQKCLTPVTELWRAKASPLGLLITGLDKSSSDCLSSNITCSCPLTTLVTLCWSCSSLKLKNEFLELGNPRVTQLWFHKCGIIEKNDLSWPAGYTLANTFGLCHSGILLPHVQLQVHQDTHSLNSVGPSISPRGIPLVVTCHQMDFCTADPNLLSQAVQTIFHPLYCHLSSPYLTFLQRHSEDFWVFLRCFETYSPSVKKTTINSVRNVFVMFSECLNLQINWVFVYKIYLYLYQVGSADLGLKTF